MALVNPNIAMSYRGIELPQQNALADYAAVQQIQGGRQAQELNALKMQEARRAEAKDISRTNMLAQAGTDDTAIANALLKSGDLKGYSDFLKSRAEQSSASTKLLADKLALLPEAYKRADTPEAYLTLHQSVHADPILGPWLKSTGATPEKGLATLQNAVQTGKFDELRMGSMQSVAQLLEGMKPITVSPGASVFQGGKSVFTAPVAPAAPPTPLNVSRLIKERDALPKGDPNIAIYNDAIRKETQFAPRAITNVNLPSQEKAEQVDRGKMLVAEFGDISKAAKLAAKTLPSIDANLSILDKGFSTGFGTETVAAGAKVLAALGVADADKFATNAQVFQAKATEAVLQKQLEQKGPQTESDAQRIDQIGAQLGKTTAGNRFVLTTAKEQLKRDMEQRDFYAKWWQKNKTYDGAEDAWFSGEGGKSLFDRPALKAYVKSAEAAAAPPAANRPSLDNIFAPKK